MSDYRPSAVITVDGQSLSAAEAGLVWLRVELATGCHDAATIGLWPGSRFADTAPGAEITLALGAGRGDEDDVLTGRVRTACTTSDSVVLDAIAATAPLSHAYLTGSYVRQTIGDIVHDLVGSVSSPDSVTVDQVESDVELAVYHVDDRRSVWSYLCELAGLAGADVGCAPDGALRFVPAGTGAASHGFRHGADILAWNLGHASPGPAWVAAAHGAGSEAGAEKWHWPLGDPVGSSPASPTRVIGALGTREAADAVTQTMADRAARGAVQGSLTVLGASSVRPGDQIDVTDLPGASPGPLRVLRVTHTLDGARGLVTALSVQAA